MIVSVGDKFHLVMRRMYESQLQRHFAGVVDAAERTRDRNYARFVASLMDGNLIIAESPDALGHTVIDRLVERQKLAPYLARTAFVETSDEMFASKSADVILSFPPD